MTAPTDLITATRLGRTFKASRRTVAHLDSTIAAFAKKYPGAQLTIIQTCYNTGVAASAGTHDYDACFDFGWTGNFPGTSTEDKWLKLQAFMRAQGWGCWWRHTGTWAAQSEWHVHGFSLPEGLARFATKVGLYIDGGASQGRPGAGSSQLADYLGAAEGLAGEHTSKSDKTWRPASIPATVFNYDAWTKETTVSAKKKAPAPKPKRAKSTPKPVKDADADLLKQVKKSKPGTVWGGAVRKARQALKAVMPKPKPAKKK